MILLYSLTLFVNAALLFIIEPMMAKMILPYLGGSPAVWNTSLAFYQGLLLVGYAYAHYFGHWIGVRRHAWLHLALIFTVMLFLPVTRRYRLTGWRRLRHIPPRWFSAC